MLQTDDMACFMRALRFSKYSLSGLMTDPVLVVPTFFIAIADAMMLCCHTMSMKI